LSVAMFFGPSKMGLISLFCREFNHLDLVTELKTIFGTITKQEIDATQALISAPLLHFLELRISHSRRSRYPGAHSY
jgi:hypothetical protein